MSEPARVLVTRSRRQASALSDALRAQGMVPIEVPTIAIRFNPDALRQSVQTLDAFDDLLFTSPNGVRAFGKALEASAVPADAVMARVSTVGPATARAAERIGLNVALVPEQDFVAEGLLEVLVAGDMAGRRVLFPRAADAREILVDGLRAARADVTVIAAYEAVPPAGGTQALCAVLEQGVDVVTVASSNTARYLWKMADSTAQESLRNLPFASIGPITTAACRALGLDVVAEAEPSGIQALSDAVATWWSQRD